MAKQTINVGTAANDGTGDPIRLAFQKVNANFNEFYGVMTPNVATNTVTLYSNLIIANSSTNGMITALNYTGTSQNALYLGNVEAARYVTNNDSRILSGNLNFSAANVYFNKGFYVNTNIVANTTGLYVNTFAVTTNVSTFGNTVYIVSNGNVGIGNSAPASKLVVTGDSTLTGLLNVTGDTTITGNLIITGTTTYVNTATLDVKDKNITVAKGSANTSVANGAGITVDGTTATFNYDNSTNTWTSSIGLLSANLTTTTNTATFGNTVYFAANGNVGIGNASPTNKFSVYGNSDIVGLVAVTGNTTITGYANVSTSVNSAIFTIGTNLTANTTGIYHTGTINALSYSVGATFTANATLVNAAAVNVTGQVNTATLYAATSANVGTAMLANTTGIYHTGTINADSYSVGATFTANATLVNAAAINVTGQVNTATLYAATSANVGTAFLANTSGLYHTGTVNALSYSVGATFTANATLVNAAAVNVTGQVNTATLYATTSANIGTSFIANSTGVYSSNNIIVSANDRGLKFTTLSGSTNVGFMHQTDDNFVFYSTDTSNTQRPVWSIFANSSTSNLSVSVPMQVAGNLTVVTNTFNLGTSTAAANGYTYLPNGMKMVWGWVSANSSDGNATFSSAFSSACYQVTATSNSAVATYQAAVTSTNTTIALIRTANASSTNVFWMAIGN